MTISMLPMQPTNPMGPTTTMSSTRDGATNDERADSTSAGDATTIEFRASDDDECALTPIEPAPSDDVDADASTQFDDSVDADAPTR